jgi:hypothetical protein
VDFWTTFGLTSRCRSLFSETPKLLKRSFKYLVFNAALVGIFLLAAYYFWFPPVWRCQTIGFSDFIALSPNVYVSPESTPRQRDSLRALLPLAQQRTQEFWGRQAARSPIIFCHDEASYRDYCLINEGAGCSLGTPTGSWIVINPEGLNIDVLAHEMCHDELFTRLGWYKSRNRVPQWFDEGLALMLDYRFTNADTTRRYLDYLDEWIVLTNNGRQALTLPALRTTQEFFGTRRGEADRAHLRKAYTTAGMEVARWLDVVGRPGLNELVQAIRLGEKFPAAYRRIELKHRQQRRATAQALAS